ncbi:hypothetical protein SAMN02745823_01520 [Sporobacter termitidis DSM 10068]|uniref:Uncharacterized protein n=1 Tax=Sporobacter termitidis DSM 10068 TaxID=1123282 RepID=A0A1M5X0Y8_9FIRM|nr:hypothetical protein [Sporobacter termitidis]SHH93556.1 hypothetical protein SAMN02745823_01520 [Sporobacter termitidis DSM 10068]
MKNLLCSALIAALCFTLQPAGNAAAAPAGPRDEESALSRSAVSEYIDVPENRDSVDDGIFAEAPYNCDPQMLIPVTADNDPGFTREPEATRSAAAINFIP